jgi:hypothetical protein
LGKGEVVRVRGHAAAHQARLPQHELPVVFIAQANRFSQCTYCAFASPLFGASRSLLTVTGINKRIRGDSLTRDSMRWIGKARGKDQTTGVRSRSRRRPTRRIPVLTHPTEPRLKPLPDNFGVRRCQGVLDREIPMRPSGRLVLGAYSRHLLNQALAEACR